MFFLCLFPLFDVFLFFEKTFVTAFFSRIYHFESEEELFFQFTVKKGYGNQEKIHENNVFCSKIHRVQKFQKTRFFNCFTKMPLKRPWELRKITGGLCLLSKNAPCTRCTKIFVSCIFSKNTFKIHNKVS